jgi:hypothetical protein
MGLDAEEGDAAAPIVHEDEVGTALGYCTLKLR